MGRKGKKPDAKKAAQATPAPAVVGSTFTLDDAMEHWGLKEHHVLGSGQRTLEDGSAQVIVVTQGGQKLFYPRDAARVLSDMEKGEAVPQASAGGVFK